MHRVLERLDGLGGTLVPLSYLVGLLLGTMAYFAGYTSGSIVAVAIGLAIGSEVHSFLQQRRSRAAFAEYQRLEAAGDPGVTAAQKHLRAQVAILALLVLFQCFTATAYAASNWHPAAGYLPAWLQIGIRGCIIPLLFLLSGFLIPLHESPGAILSQASQEILHYAVNRNVRHWRRRIRTVHKRGGDLSPLMVALLEEAGEDSAARRTSLIAANLQTAEHQLQQRPGFWARLRGKATPDTVMGALIAPASASTLASAASLTSAAGTSNQDGPEHDPHGPGRPGGGQHKPSRRPQSAPRSPVLTLVSDTTARSRRGASRAMEENAQLRAQRTADARIILARNSRISAERLGEMIGAPKTVALGIKRELQAEARGADTAARPATRPQRRTRPAEATQAGA